MTSTETAFRENATSRPTPGAAPLESTGKLVIADAVLEKIAGIAARNTAGIYSLGRAGLRGALAGVAGTVTRSAQLDRGISSEHGEKEAAFDLDVVCEYGVNIPSVIAELRRNITKEVASMTDLRTVEINISVLDIHIPGEETEEEEGRTLA
ncbi:MAG: Asp23/Gls24 family envelope stress response protein [Dehalococcoidia bacterium]|nr:Asp23/Gls24 family envelope stress response protein [Dehalococcoidia bacterium]